MMTEPSEPTERSTTVLEDSPVIPSFADLGLAPDMVALLAAAGITVPTAVQVAALPTLLAGKDALIESRTGSGKTLAYLLPMLALLARAAEGSEGPPADLPLRPGEPKKAAPAVVILVPTQELGMQVRDVARAMAPAGLRVLSLIGGANPRRQAEQLAAGADLVVGTPGRVLEFMREKRLSGVRVRYLVLDEADQLIDEGNRRDTEAIVKATSPSRQTVLCSATLGDEAVAWGRRLARDPLPIKVDQALTMPTALKHLAFVIDERDKLSLMRRLLRHYNPVGALAFHNHGRDIDELAAKLAFHGVKVAALHSGTRKLARAATMRDFRTGKLQLLLATELAARGLDLSGVSLVFNLDLPTGPPHYVHRVGRTARMGQAGTAITLVDPVRAFVLGKLEKALGFEFERPVFREGDVREATPIDVRRAAGKTAAKVRREAVIETATKATPSGAADTVDGVAALPKKPKKSKIKGPTDRALAKGKAKKAKKRSADAFQKVRSKRPIAGETAVPNVPSAEPS